MRKALLLILPALALSLLIGFTGLPANAEDPPYIWDWTQDEKKKSLGNLPPEFFNADAPAIVKKVIKAYGGHAAILASERMLAKGRIFDIADEKHYTYMHYMATGNRFRKDKIVEGRSEVWVLNGWRSFSGLEGMVRYKLKGLALKELELEHTFLALPLMLSGGSYKASYLGSASSGGGLVYSMMVETTEGNVLGVDVDVKSGLITSVVARLEHEGESLPVEYRFSSYIPVNDTKLPRKISIFRDDVLIEQVEIFKYTPNPVMSDFLFE